MKKKVMLSIGATVMTLMMITVLSANSSSLSQLRAQAEPGYCETAASSDCESPSTGNIYFGYKLHVSAPPKEN